MVIHSTSEKVLWMLAAAFSPWCCQLSSSIRIGGAAERDRGRLQVDEACRARSRGWLRPSTIRLCFSSVQSSMVSMAFIAMTWARSSAAARMPRPHIRWIITSLDHQHDDDHRRQVIDEVVEVEPDQRADQDVGRIADQGGGAADVGGEDLGEQEGIGRNLELAGDGQRHRHDQQHGGDVVEQRRQQRGDHLQQQQDAPRRWRWPSCAAHTATYWNMPERREIDTRIIMPVSRPMVLKSMPRDRLVLVEHADRRPSARRRAGRRWRG